MGKNIKTIRLSDDMIELIEQQAGENFTAKFEALVTRCIWELPHQEEELAKLQQKIDYEKKRLKELKETTDRYKHTFDNIRWSIENIDKRLTDLANLQYRLTPGLRAQRTQA